MNLTKNSIPPIIKAILISPVTKKAITPVMKVETILQVKDLTKLRI